MMHNIRKLDILIAREEEHNEEVDSDDTIAHFCALHHSAIMCPCSSYQPNWLLGLEMNMGNIVHTHTHIYLVGIYDMTCRAISEIGT